MDPAGPDRRESGSGSLGCEAAVLGRVSTRNPYWPLGGPPLLTAGEPGYRLGCRLKTIARARWEESQFARNHQNRKPRKGPSDAGRRTDYETRGSGPGIACPQRDRAQNPVNTTRTCNKLPDVYT
jgi:hypothetical protein